LTLPGTLGCENIADKEKWWSSVEGLATATTNKKRITVAEAVKKVFVSK